MSRFQLADTVCPKIYYTYRYTSTFKDTEPCGNYLIFLLHTQIIDTLYQLKAEIILTINFNYKIEQK